MKIVKKKVPYIYGWHLMGDINANHLKWIRPWVTDRIRRDNGQGWGDGVVGRGSRGIRRPFRVQGNRNFRGEGGCAHPLAFQSGLARGSGPGLGAITATATKEM